MTYQSNLGDSVTPPTCDNTQAHSKHDGCPGVMSKQDFEALEREGWKFDPKTAIQIKPDNLLLDIIRKHLIDVDQHGYIEGEDDVVAAKEIQSLINKARVDENKSIEVVLLYEIDKPDRCDLHDKYVSACYGCRERRWRAKIRKEYLETIQDCLATLNKLKGES